MQCSWSNSGMLSYDLTVSRRKNSGLSGFFCYSNHLWANANRMKPNAVQYAAQDSMQIILIVKCNAIQQGPYRHDVNRTLPMCSIKKCHHHFFFLFHQGQRWRKEFEDEKPYDLESSGDEDFIDEEDADDVYSGSGSGGKYVLTESTTTQSYVNLLLVFPKR